MTIEPSAVIVSVWRRSLLDISEECSHPRNSLLTVYAKAVVWGQWASPTAQHVSTSYGMAVR
jgi:hypothetical protein